MISFVKCRGIVWVVIVGTSITQPHKACNRNVKVKHLHKAIGVSRATYLLQRNLCSVSDITALPLEVWMGLITNNKHNIRRNFVASLITFFLECDFRARLPARLHIYREHLVFLLRGAVRLQHFAANLHLLRAPFGDVLQRHVQVVLYGGVLHFVFIPVRAVVEIETLASEGASRPGPDIEAKGIVYVHIVVVKTEHGLSSAEIEKRLERAGVAEELGESGPGVSVELVGEVGVASDARSAGDSALQTFFAVHVVDLALLLVGQYLVGLRNLLEALLGPGGFILVRMVLQGQLTVRFLDVIVGCTLADPQNFVVIFAHFLVFALANCTELRTA